LLIVHLPFDRAAAGDRGANEDHGAGQPGGELPREPEKLDAFDDTPVRTIFNRCRIGQLAATS